MAAQFPLYRGNNNIAAYRLHTESSASGFTNDGRKR